MGIIAEFWWDLDSQSQASGLFLIEFCKIREKIDRLFN